MGAFPAIRKAVMDNYNNYKDLSSVDIQADRYAKFRKIGLYEDFIIRGGQRASALEERAKKLADGGYKSKAGTLCATAEEAELVELLADADEKWESILAEKQDEWCRRPAMPDGLQTTGLMYSIGSKLGQRRRRQADIDADLSSTTVESSEAATF